MKENKIVFIAGIPGVGKTSLSGIIAKEFNIDIVMSGDYLREFYRKSAKKQPEVMAVSVYDAWKYFGEKNSENIIKGYLAQASVMNTGIIPMIERANKNGENLVIESLYVDDDMISALQKNSATVLYLYISNKKVHEKRLGDRTLYTHYKSPGSRLIQQLDTYGEMMNYSIDLCKKHGIATFDNLDFSTTVTEVLKFIKKPNVKS